MRRHAKAPFGGTKTHRAADLGSVLLSAFVAIAVLMGLGAAPASALKTHFYEEDFGSAAKPEFSNPMGVAIDQSTGDVLVLDVETNTVRRYKSDGTPDNFPALGSNVIDGEGTGLGDDKTPQGAFSFTSSPVREQVAVDDSGTATDGDIYVTQLLNHVVDVFSSTGAYLGQLTAYKEGSGATGASTALGPVAGVAAGPDGSLYVSDLGGYIHKYVPSANPPVNADNVANFSYPVAANLAVGVGPTAGFVFAVSREGNGSLSKLDASTGAIQYVVEEQVKSVSVDPATGEVYAAMVGGEFGPHSRGGFTHFDASGSTSPVFIAYVAGPGEGQTTATGVAVRGSTGRVYLSESFVPRLRVFGPLLTEADLEILPPQEVSATRARLRGSVNPDGVAITECKFEYGTVESGTFSNSVPCEGSVPTDTSNHAVSAVVGGLPADGAEYQYRLVVTNSDSRTAITDAETFDLLLPILTGRPTTVSAHSAEVTGVVRPEGEQVTECEFEYGPTASYGASAPCSPTAGSIPADFSAHAVGATLEGLDEYSVSHYRLVFSTAGVTRTGQDELFRTRGPSGLPDNRRYEQVSPVDKNHSDLEPGLSVASVEGNRLVFYSKGSFAGAPTAQQVEGLDYLASRGPGGWSTESIAPPGGEFEGTGYAAFSQDLSRGALLWPEKNLQAGTLDPNAKPGINLYMREAGNSSFTLVNGTLDDIGGRSVVWGSSDLRHLAIVSHNPLTVDAPAASGQCDGKGGAGNTKTCAYEWDNGVLRLASVLPNGEPTVGAPGSQIGGRSCSGTHAVSDDGSRLFFTSPPEPFEASRLYAREEGTSTTLISESERTLPGGLGGQRVDYQDAEAAHGGRVLFTTKNSLVDEDTDETNDLYLYDYTKPAGERLTLVSRDENPNAPEGAEVDGGAEPFGDLCGGVMGASEDLRRIYFVADNQIVPDEPEGAGPKLYLWDDTGASSTTTYLGTLSPHIDFEHPGDRQDWRGALKAFTAGTEIRNARVSRDGRYLGFLSTAKLTDFDNEGEKEVYRYDAVEGKMECASCSEDAVPARGEIGFTEEEKVATVTIPVLNRVSTNVTDTGQVFFETTRGLIPADSNGKSDVYEYENGQLRLISTGEGSGDSYFLDATPSGSDVFFTTKDRLVGWDTDENIDAYDAREGGGFPEPLPSPPPCEGDACQPAPNAPNDPTPGSSSFEGAGNVTERRSRHCARATVRRHGKCVKRRKHAKRHAEHQRTATRSHG